MLVQDRISIPDEALAELCRRYYVRELALFGSVLRDDFRDDSDIDVLVEFEPNAPVGLLEFIGLKQDLADLIGRDVDLVEKAGLKRFLRDSVLSSAQVIYVPVDR
jgi:predicted nucleotidyltransferase